MKIISSWIYNNDKISKERDATSLGKILAISKDWIDTKKKVGYQYYDEVNPCTPYIKYKRWSLLKIHE